ncbi:trimethylguanosine synthase, putative [Entamoeba dispar SAW760]|uniref:Trimethylguanosine synthase n=1 Tax=Entamoeba dispar (strain ATCC PRA-260 / SAW760) TaxID=370354 RepID=B0E8J1_ENTDS|nr:trimethylguanosine synthase, putative [Entamoeba dispar SAW760]EDR29134.1 trimethylguanosine synthase, putative [Entamoeba dispar SAW760]|eukprot:EDR29134.1 trimethylguanosine synthase, putative [Entamoeba dispar SAW760]
MSIQHYYKQRYQLFSLYDKGILMDEEAWYSVTPEAIAKHIAQRVQQRLFFLNKPIKVLDLFCCVGGDSIQQAVAGSFVTSVDFDPIKLELLEHNAQIYGVSNRIKTVNEDAFTFIKRVNEADFDVILIAPPWGGPTKCRNKRSLNQLFDGLQQLYQTCVNKCLNVILYLPKDMDPQDIITQIDFPFERVEYSFGDHKVMQVLLTGALIVN